MFKIIFLLLGLYAALSKARPSYVHGAAAVLPSYETVAYAPTVVGHTYESLPTAISHQSSTIVHEKRPYLRPIVEHHPAASYVKAYSPALSYVAAPLSYAPYGSYGGWLNEGWGPSIYVK